MGISVATPPAIKTAGKNFAGDAAVDGSTRALDEALARVAELEEELSQQAQARSELIHLVTHELRTPITIISGFNRLLRSEADPPLSEQQDHFVEESLKACRRLDAFVGDLLDARADGSTPMPVVQQRVSGEALEALIRAQLESLQPLLEDRGLRLEGVFDLPKLALSLDLTRIEQVVTNLVSNAIRYGRRGGVIRISVGASAEKAAVGGRFPVEVAVEDDGPGIPVADRERLFQPYVRGRMKQEGASSQNEGLGIGLSICRRILAAHGGSIAVESSSLGGARFVFGLPSAPHSDVEG
ncbi:MAG: sensor histidine kinase [Myxococcota bacterium]